MNAVTFDAAAHTYTAADGRALMSVTTAIRGAGLMDDRWWSSEARSRGTRVHQAIARSNARSLDWDTLESDVWPYVTAWTDFRAFGVETVLLWEHVVADVDRGYAGTLDAALVLRGDPTVWVVDAKTGAAPSWVGLQTAAYARPLRALLDEPRIRRGVLELRDGRFTLTELTERSDERVFLAVLEIALWKRAHS